MLVSLKAQGNKQSRLLDGGGKVVDSKYRTNGIITCSWLETGLEY